jgi:hypothetical protein
MTDALTCFLPTVSIRFAILTPSALGFNTTVGIIVDDEEGSTSINELAGNRANAVMSANTKKNTTDEHTSASMTDNGSRDRCFVAFFDDLLLINTCATPDTDLFVTTG